MCILHGGWRDDDVFKGEGLMILKGDENKVMCVAE